LLHSISRQEHEIKALGESEFVLLELRMRAFSIVKFKGQERRVIGGVLVYIGLSKESSLGLRFKIRTISSGAGQSLARGFCEIFLNYELTRVGPDNVRLDVSVLGGLKKDLEFARLNNFYFIQHTLLNSMVFTYSGNIKLT
jgi:hypothetical protein